MKTLTQRAAAETLVAEVAVRLGDPDDVAAREGWRKATDSSRRAETLADGFAGIALLFAELGHEDARHRVLCHRYLSAALECLPAKGPAMGLFGGFVGTALAARAAAHTNEDYATLLARLDADIAEFARAAVSAQLERVSDGRVMTDFAAYDLISGLSGLGRYLLHPGVDQPRALGDVLSYLVALAEPVTMDGVVLPGWWIDDAPRLGQPGFEGGHANFGMAHGLPGPLALLALARLRGHRTAGQDEAITRMAGWLLSRRHRDEAGTFWPHHSRAELMGEPDIVPGAPAPSWCYGTPGIARALQLAGRALGRRDWVDAALEAARATVRRLERDCGIVQPGLCHGWAGVLHCLRRVRAGHDDPVLGHGVREVARRVLAGADGTTPYMFPVPVPEAEPDVHDPGFLTGAAGVALVLHSYARGTAPAGGWDAALMLI